MKKRALVVSGVIALGAAGFGPTALAHAASSNNNSSTATSKRVSRRSARMDAKLNQAVRDGVITTDQKTAFKNELRTLKAERKADGITKSSSSTDKQTERTKLRDQLKSWASSNNFPLSKIMPKLAGSTDATSS